MRSPNPKLFLASIAQLKRSSYFLRLQTAVRNSGISERDWPTVIQDTLLHLDMRGARIFTAPEPYPTPLVDDVWKSERYIGDFLAASSCKYPDRDRLIDLYFRVNAPQIAKHFDR